MYLYIFFFFSSRRRHTRYIGDWSSDVCSSDLVNGGPSNGGIQLKKVTRQAVKHLEREIILKMLEVTAWNRKAAAHALSISYPALLYKMKEAGLPLKRANAPVSEPTGSSSSPL